MKKIIVCLNHPELAKLSFPAHYEKTSLVDDELRVELCSREVVCLVTDELGGSSRIVEYVKKVIGGSLGRLPTPPRFLTWEHVVEEGVDWGDLFLEIEGGSTKRKVSMCVLERGLEGELKERE